MSGRVIKRFMRYEAEVGGNPCRGQGDVFAKGVFFRLAELLPKLGDLIGIWRDWADDGAGLWVVINTTAEAADFPQ